MKDLETLAQDPTEPVLVVGPRGSGKTVVAGAIHELSPRSLRPFVKLDLAHLSGELAGSDLFGHKRGAFTGAISDRPGAFHSADTGTLFLDELLKAPLDVQQRLLNAVEYGEVRKVGSDRTEHVNVRVVAATNASDDELADESRLLPDLFGRLRSYVIRIAPLRQRRSDIPVLLEDALQRAAAAVRGEPPPSIHPEVQDLLLQHDWPDNVRELASTVRRLVLEARGAHQITTDHCHPSLAFSAPLHGRRRRRRPPEEIAAAILRSEGKMMVAAELAGVSVATAYRHRERLKHAT